MKFGKRLETEAERCWMDRYIDYKGLKKAIKADLLAEDAETTRFKQSLWRELQKVGAFYEGQEGRVQHMLKHHDACRSKENIKKVKQEVNLLRKFVMLNYIAVVKAVKKRNRHVKNISNAARVCSMKASQILMRQYIFTTLKLAEMVTQVEILSKQFEPEGSNEIEEYSCPICLNVLRNPVLLSCAHRYCWGCIVSLCSAVKQNLTLHQQEEVERDMVSVKGPLLSDGKGTAQEGSVLHAAVWEADSSDDERATLATFSCPCCRKQELLDLDRLHVDQNLSEYILQLEKREHVGALVVALPSMIGCVPA